MSSSDGGSEEQRVEAGPAAPSDLFDFYRRWPEFRQTATSLTASPYLSFVERQTLGWLIELADRVREDDIGSVDGG
jgi:hypothetical protein